MCLGSLAYPALVGLCSGIGCLDRMSLISPSRMSRVACLIWTLQVGCLRVRCLITPVQTSYMSMSASPYRISRVACPVRLARVACLAADVPFGSLVLDVLCYMSRVGCLVLDVSCWMSRVGCLVLDVSCWMS